MSEFRLSQEVELEDSRLKGRVADFSLDKRMMFEALRKKPPECLQELAHWLPGTCLVSCAQTSRLASLVVVGLLNNWQDSNRVKSAQY